MTPEVKLPEHSDGFLELARITWLAQTSVTPQSITPIHVLAALLRAASQGVGALTLSGLHLNESEIVTLAQYPEFFALEDHLVLLPRYAAHRNRIRTFFAERLTYSRQSLNHRDIHAALEQLLPHERTLAPQSGRLLFDNTQQRLAIAALVDAPIGILTGGPGTGKTTTAAAMLALQKRLQPNLSPAAVLVTAPTGKAACRIGEAIFKATQNLSGLTSEEREFLRNIRAITLHKALEWTPIPPENGGPFGRGPTRPIEAEIVLVDEASMVDLGLMDALVQALSKSTSLLLLGDSDQLESVEVGGILSELVRAARMSALPKSALEPLALRLGCTPENVETAFEEGLPLLPKTATEQPLPGLVFGLKTSRRAMNAPWILDLANLIRPESKADFPQLESLFDENVQPELVWYRQKPSLKRTLLCKTIWSSWKKTTETWIGLSPESPEAELQKPLSELSKFQLLCSSNTQVNRANLEGLAALWGKAKAAPNTLPHGCPILVSANNPSLGLSNGDIGIALGQKPEQPATLALFASSNGSPRLIPLAQIPGHCPAFALTIHKSQGSEWAHVAIELPHKPGSRLLSRNLLYTAVTRSSCRIDLFGSDAVLQEFFAPQNREKPL